MLKWFAAATVTLYSYFVLVGYFLPGLLEVPH